MTERKMPDGVREKYYVDGFLNQNAADEVTYGYSTNHMPQTTEKRRQIASSYESASKAK